MVQREEVRRQTEDGGHRSQERERMMVNSDRERGRWVAGAEGSW